MVPEQIILSRSNPGQIRPDVGDGKATFFWGPPPSDGGSAITSYTLFSSATGMSFNLGPTDFSLTLTGLTNGADYQFAIYATNADGNGPPAYFRSIQPGFRPGPPENVIVSIVNSTTAKISWTTPAYNGDAQILGYAIKGSNVSLSARSNDTHRLITGLTGGNPSAYDFTIYTVNDPGYSPGITNQFVVLPGLLLALDSSNYTGGETWTDLSPNGNNASLSEGTGQTSNSYVYFDGSTFFETPAVGVLSNFTVSLWFKPFIIPETYILPIFGEDYTNDFSFIFGYQGGIYYTASVSYGENIFNTGSINIQNNVWNNIVITCDGTTVIPYLNNNAASPVPVEAPFVSNQGPIYIGGKNNCMTGLIGQALIYNRALPPDELSYNYYRNSNKYPN
jgi:hypothetical protein